MIDLLPLVHGWIMAGLMAFESITSMKLVSKSSLAGCKVRHTREQMPCCRQDMRKALFGSLQVVSACSTRLGNRGLGIGGQVGGAPAAEIHRTYETGQAGATEAHVLSGKNHPSITKTYGIGDAAQDDRFWSSFFHRWNMLEIRLENGARDSSRAALSYRDDCDNTACQSIHGLDLSLPKEVEERGRY